MEAYFTKVFRYVDVLTWPMRSVVCEDVIDWIGKTNATINILNFEFPPKLRRHKFEQYAEIFTVAFWLGYSREKTVFSKSNGVSRAIWVVTLQNDSQYGRQPFGVHV